MKKLAFVFIASNLLALNLSGQVGIGTTNPNPSAILDLYSPDFGLLIPRITTDRRLSMTPVNGMMVYDTDYKQFYVYENDVWTSMGTGDPTWVRNASLNQTYLANQNDIVGLGTYSPVASAKLDIRSTTKGLMIPKMTQTQMSAIASPATGLLVFNSTANTFYYHNGTAWTMMVAGKLKDADGDTRVEVEKNTDEDIIRFTLAGSEKMTLTGNRLEMPKSDNANLFIGMSAGKANTTGYLNTALGDSTLRYNTTGYHNTAAGYASLWKNTTGYKNTAYGINALSFNTTGTHNTALGGFTLSQNDTGSYNIAIGTAALNNNIASRNVAVGTYALSGNSTGSPNIAIGYEALFFNNTGNHNIALGAYALHENTPGSRNMAIGTAALYSNYEWNDLIAIGDSALYSHGSIPLPEYYPDTPEGNVAIGTGSLRSNTLGHANIAIGRGTLYHNKFSFGVIAIGDSALFNNDRTTENYYNNRGWRNIAIGDQALKNNTIGRDNIAIGDRALYKNESPDNGAYPSSENIAIGTYALTNNTGGTGNTAIGYSVMAGAYGSPEYHVAIGWCALLQLDNEAIDEPAVAIGMYALRGKYSENVNHYGNTAVGHSSMVEITLGSRNVSVGYRSLENNGTGSGNSVSGYRAMQENVSGNSNVAVGIHALYSATQQSNLVAIGDSALFNNNYTGTTNPDYATKNTAVGSKALYTNTTGYSNTAIGFKALYANNTGTNNTAVGSEALSAISNTNYNSAYGDKALKSNTGSFNVGVGASALQASGAGGKNAAVGYSALSANTAGDENTAVGYNALNKNTTGDYNIAVGSKALYNNSTGTSNVVIGYEALGQNSSSTNLVANVAIGYRAGGVMTTGFGNVVIGENTGSSITTGSDNVWIGKGIGSSGAPNYWNSIAVGLNTPVDASDKARIGNPSVNSIGGQVNWTAFSDGRFKRNLREDVPGISFISLLIPVTYNVDITALNEHYYPEGTMNTNPDAENIRYTGFVAQDVEAAAMSIGYDFSGVDKSSETLGLRYAEFVVPLVKAVQEQQAMIDKLQQENVDLRQRLEKIEASLME